MAGDLGDVIVGDGESDRRFHNAVERQVQIALSHDQRAVHRVRRRERDHQTARPVSDRARTGGQTGGARSERSIQIHPQVSTSGAGHVHLAGRVQSFECQLDTPREIVVPTEPLEDVGMLVGDHQDSGTATKDRTKFRRMQQTLDGAVDDQPRRRQRRDDCGICSNGLRRARRADRHRMGGWRCGHDDIEEATTERLCSEPRCLDKCRTALRFTEQRDDFTLDQAAAAEVGRESLDESPLRHRSTLRVAARCICSSSN